MSRFAPKGLALTGSIMAIVVASLLFIGGIVILVDSRGDDRMLLAQLVKDAGNRVQQNVSVKIEHPSSSRS